MKKVNSTTVKAAQTTETTTGAKPVKYLDLISQSQTDITAEQLAFKADDAKLAVMNAEIATRKSISSKKIELSNAQRAIDYDIQKEINIIAEIESLEKGLLFIQKVLKERF